MNNSTIVLIFSGLLAAMVIAVLVLYHFLEKKKKKTLSKTFRTFSENYSDPNKDLRIMPRIPIPEELEVTLTLTDDEYFSLKSRALDISLNGFSVKPEFPLRKLPMNILVHNVLVVTPINTFAIKEMKTVRIDHHIDRRLMAFQVVRLDDDQKENIHSFMSYLDEFKREGMEKDDD